MRSFVALLFICAGLSACETAPEAQHPSLPTENVAAQPKIATSDAPGPVQVFRPMQPIADDEDDQPTRPIEPVEPTRPVDTTGTLTSPAACSPLETIDDQPSGRTTFYRMADGTISFSADMDVNTDGALTSYSAADPGYYNSGGRLATRKALNTVCNGLKVVGAGAKPDLGPRECSQLLEAFQQFRDAGWPRFNADGDRIRFYAIEARADAGADRNVPCLVDNDWMVSTTSIEMSGTYSPCDPNKWLDARRFNAIVMPPQVLAAARATAGGGDLVAVRYRGRMFGAVVGDTNPRKVGEGTLALTLALRALDPEPPEQPQGLRAVYGIAIVRPPVEYFVFPGTKGKALPLTNARSGEIAQAALAEAAARGIPGVRACGFDAARARAAGPVRRLTPEEGLNDDPDVLKNEN